MRRRIREWLEKRRVRKEENPLPSFSNRSINDRQQQLNKPEELSND
ncbi:hypothetical protein KHB02_019125 [Bacillus sp. FJAT-50051]|uniref:Uncharacterized protein n=1 Tax=Neobacillus citreus TaxID=2833578 RepID=A0A9J6MUL7_9BACI|nr:hypothetical protein [Neobacillus citreus]